MGVMYKSKETNLDFCDQKGYGKFYLKCTKSTWPSTLFAATEKQTIKANWQSVGTGRWFYSIFDVFTCFENFINIFQTYSFPSLTSRSPLPVYQLHVLSFLKNIQRNETWNPVCADYWAWGLLWMQLINPVSFQWWKLRFSLPDIWFLFKRSNWVNKLDSYS